MHRPGWSGQFKCINLGQASNHSPKAVLQGHGEFSQGSLSALGVNPVFIHLYHGGFLVFWKDLSCCCCTAIVGTFPLILAIPFAVVEILIPTLSTPLLSRVTFPQLEVSVSLPLILLLIVSSFLVLVALPPSQRFKSSCDCPNTLLAWDLGIWPQCDTQTLLKLKFQVSSSALYQ